MDVMNQWSFGGGSERLLTIIDGEGEDKILDPVSPSGVKSIEINIQENER